MNKLKSPITLVVVAILALLGALYLSAEHKAQREKIENLQSENTFLYQQISSLRDKYYSESLMLSEYQEALSEYMTINPVAADEFMKLVEKQFE